MTKAGFFWVTMLHAGRRRIYARLTPRVNYEASLVNHSLWNKFSNMGSLASAVNTSNDCTQSMWVGDNATTDNSRYALLTRLRRQFKRSETETIETTSQLI